MNHMCGGVFTAKDVLSKAMKHADELLSRMDFTLEGAIDRASNMFDNAINYATFMLVGPTPERTCIQS